MTSTEDDSVLQELKQKFSGKWKQVRCENVDDFFKEMGLNYFIRKLAILATPVVDIVVEGANIEVSFQTPMRQECMKYKLNEEVEVENQKGKFNAKTTYENGKLTSKQEPVPGNDAKPTVTERELNEAGELVTTIYVGDVVCTRVFTKLE